ncbi:MAG: hypothetical protein ABIG89_05100 [Candidatus Woesearchaeota archaeon]
MAIKYKKQCIRCKKNYVLITWKTNFPICFECQKNELNGKIDDPVMKKMFDIPDDYYEKSGFLRNIKINYLKYGELSEKQIEKFKEVAKKMKEGND